MISFQNKEKILLIIGTVVGKKTHKTIIFVQRIDQIQLHKIVNTDLSSLIFLYSRRKTKILYS